MKKNPYKVCNGNKRWRTAGTCVVCLFVLLFKASSYNARKEKVLNTIPSLFMKKRKMRKQHCK